MNDRLTNEREYQRCEMVLAHDQDNKKKSACENIAQLSLSFHPEEISV